MWRSDLFFIGVFRGVIAESSRSRRGVVAESVPGSLFFVGQNGGVAVESSRSRSSPRHGGSRSGLVFNRWDGGVGAESARSRRGVVAWQPIFCGAKWRSRVSAAESSRGRGSLSVGINFRHEGEVS